MFSSLLNLVYLAKSGSTPRIESNSRAQFTRNSITGHLVLISLVNAFDTKYKRKTMLPITRYLHVLLSSNSKHIINNFNFEHMIKH